MSNDQDVRLKEILEILELREDAAGSGTFRARRDGGKRSHNGVDLVVSEGDPVNSPVEGTVTKVGYPYRNDLKYRYVEITDDASNKHRIFYVTPGSDTKVGSRVHTGQSLGTSQDVSKRYPGRGMKPHIHYEIKDREEKFIDPNAILKL